MINEAATSFLALAELSKYAMFSFDIELSKFTYTNPAFKEYITLKDDSPTIDNIEKQVHPDDAVFVKQAFEELLKLGRTNNCEFRIVLPDTTVKTIRVETFISSLVDKRRIILGIIEDISSFREHSDTLNKFSNKKNALLNILSHDLLGPLGTIQNLSTLIKKKTSESEGKEISQLIDSIEKISMQSILMIRNLLSQEFLESANAELVLRRVNIVNVIRETLVGYKQSEETLERIFNFSVSSEGIQVDIDETKIVQALNNLLSNAIKFTQENGVINVSIKEEDNTILLAVSDNGVGIPTKYHADLFNKFTPARRTGLHGEVSHGLGMSIIKSIIEWHHGQIWVESKENQGTTFYIRLPWTR